MKKIVQFTFCLVTAFAFGQSRELPVDTVITTQHNATINGASFSYTAQTGTQPVWDENAKPIASLHYTYYTRNNIKDRAARPLLISFNGGPGSGSVWMHLAYTGPKVLKIDDEGYPVQPYGVNDNPHSVLDIADIVYVNPVNTGYSRTIPASGKEVDRDKFFGINADIKYLAEWLNTFVTRNNRWRSPKYIIGESYGGTRVMGLSLALQNQQWMYLNGVIMVSPADYKVIRNSGPVAEAINLPYYTAAAWHHKALPPALQSKDLLEILPESEAYTIDKLIPALAKGGFLEASEKEAVADKMAYYSGLNKKDILDHNLSVPTSFFWKNLLKDKSGHTVGRLDSRYLGIDKQLSGTKPDYNSELTSWLHSFTPAINYYLQEELNFKTDVKYNMFGPVHPWNNDDDNTRDNLRQAMAQNPYLNVLVQSGYYDGATTYFNAKYTMWQVDPSGRMKDRFSFKGYRSGHMMYLRREDLKTANDDIRDFINRTIATGKSAKY
ncbi:carboxypeptidase [Maribacter sp. 6B07]|uniref:Carboxypeptidase C (Cathepsin A) n=1 Tax=Maribacter dokdonensis TaxID=320912 RepID=A0A1H4RN50_9FLAO|nr:MULTISPECIES: carboxypeptidase [Maribacter]APA65784.1 carboxypeptidase [Maribacter sp. 1_2014MBL_MicDiv]PHN93721.1 carboxypeptidase [Maribacter sp. 6B07]SEC33101.1 Carboxypeptidase C (cathepsin A) [Maribacter dokdonensis]HAF78101.1 carboxypeptidase [Maribacter sp.]|tara:strand:+ start:80249 stop:81733 length:1485 start_codon:yes stop_codon:yes gene_type:complete